MVRGFGRRDFFVSLGAASMAGFVGRVEAQQPSLPVLVNPKPAVVEPALMPEQRIIDPHHHLWARPADPATNVPARRYLIEEFAADLASGHKVVATVNVEGDGTMYRKAAPPHLAPVGETEFIAGIAAMSASGQYGPTQICAGVVGHVDLANHATVQTALDAHIRAAGGRMRGVRDIGTWDADDGIRRGRWRPLRHRYLDPNFRRGFARLQENGLSFDAWLYHPQLNDVYDLAAAFPATTIVIDHCGGLVRTGEYARDPVEAMAVWRAGLTRLATRENVVLKIGGLGMFLTDLQLEKRQTRIGSIELANLLRPIVATCIEIFGPSRCMFESNFPVDKASYDYGVLWNAYKRIIVGYNAEERDALLFKTANKAYRLGMESVT